MSDHSIIIDLQYPQGGRFECNAPDNSPCKAQWDCECEYIPNYEVIDGKPTHYDTWDEWAINNGKASRCVGRFDNTQCNLGDWYDNQDEAVEGTVRIDVTPVHDVDYVTFTAIAARTEIGL